MARQRKPPPPELTPRKQPRQVRAAVTVDAIVVAAERVLARGGLDALTTNRVAEVAGVSIGSVYQYFPDKDAIVAALIERYLGQYYGAFSSILDAAAAMPLELATEGVLRAAMQVFAGQAKIHGTLYERMFALGMTPAFQRVLERYVARIAEYLGARTDVAVASPEVAAFLVFHAAEGIARAVAMAGRTPGQDDLHISELCRMIVGYLRPEPG